MQLSDFIKTAENPNFAIQYIPQPNPYVYYDAILKRPVVNDTGIKIIRSQLDYITNIIKKENIQIFSCTLLYTEFFRFMTRTSRISKVFLLATISKLSASDVLLKRGRRIKSAKKMMRL